MAMVQYGLWPNCTNHCDFCLLKDKRYKSVKQRLNILSAIKHNIGCINWKTQFSDGVSLLGGEVFYTESDIVKEKFLELLDYIINTVLLEVPTAKLSTVTNGIYNPNILLIPVLDKLKAVNLLDRLDINFSYDLKYRFHTEESLNQMIQNTNLVYNKYGIIPGVQTCLTQYLIDKHLNNTFNLFDYKETYFPHTHLAFLYPHKINTGIVIDDFFFKRKDLIKFIAWLKTQGYNDIVSNFYQSVINSSQFKYTGLWDREPVIHGNTSKKYTEQLPTLEEKQNLTECGHSDMYRCYSDSDRCMLCDLIRII